MVPPTGMQPPRPAVPPFVPAAAGGPPNRTGMNTNYAPTRPRTASAPGLADESGGQMAYDSEAEAMVPWEMSFLVRVGQPSSETDD